MIFNRFAYVFVTALLLSACAGGNVLTQEEVMTQNKADAIVAGVLFDYEMDTAASYNVRKDGYIVIKFDDHVPADKYTEVVGLIRANADVKGVRAEQNGIEVCPLRF